jgi:hypothetical protein
MDFTLNAIDMAVEIIEMGLARHKGPPPRRLLQLVAAYISNDGGVKTVANRMAKGFGLQITSVSEDGIVLSKDPEHDSIFMAKRDDLVEDAGADARLVRGICNAAILACAYMRQQSLYSDTVQTVTADEVYEMLVEASTKLSAEVDNSAGNLRGLTEAAKIVERMKADSYSDKSGKARRGTLRGQILQAFKYFVDHNLMVKDREDGGGTFKTLPELRVRLQMQGAEDIAEAIIAATKGDKYADISKEADHG